MLGALFKGIGSLLEKGLGAAGDAGHFIRYTTGLTGQELKAAGRASSRKVGRILGREEQAAASMANRAASYGERFSSRVVETSKVAESTKVAEVSKVYRDPTTGKFLQSGKKTTFAPAGSMYTPYGQKLVSGSPIRVPQNTARYERAYASRQRAINFGLNRLLPAAGFYAAGRLGGALIENRAEMQKSYLGEEEYTSKYGTSAQTAASIVRGAGTFLGIESLLGVNPVQGTIAGFKQFKQFRKASAVFKRARRREATYAKISRPASPTATAPLRPTAKVRASRRAEAAARSGRNQRNRTARRQDQLNRRKDTKLRSRTGPGSQQEFLNRGSIVPRSPQRKYAQTRLARAEKRLESTATYLRGVNSTPLATAAVVGAVGTIGLSQADTPFGLGVTAGALGLGLSITPLGKGIGKFVSKYPAESLAGVGALTAGAAIGMRRSHYASAEGNIEDVSYERESATSKLNYSTAGLVQSIHNNRRRM